MGGGWGCISFLGGDQGSPARAHILSCTLVWVPTHGSTSSLESAQMKTDSSKSLSVSGITIQGRYALPSLVALP